VIFAVISVGSLRRFDNKRQGSY